MKKIQNLKNVHIDVGEQIVRVVIWPIDNVVVSLYILLLMLFLFSSNSFSNKLTKYIITATVIVKICKFPQHKLACFLLKFE